MSKPSFQHFTAFTTNYGGRARCLLTKLMVSPPFDPAPPQTTHPPNIEIVGLWDTGATNSMITKATADALGLVPTGSIEINHAGGKSVTNTHLVNFFLPNNVVIPFLPVSECPGLVPNAGALIGMDVIASGDFAVTNVGGKTCLSFRVPSIEKIDYTAMANKIKFSGVGRNDPCPCGSGKKFKKCCGNKLNP
jgi:hypothetical protein